MDFGVALNGGNHHLSTRLPYLLLIVLIGFTSLCIRGLLTLHEWLHSPKLLTTYPVEATNQLLLINAACLTIPPLPIPLFSACAICGRTTTWKRRIIGRLNTKHMQTIGLLWIGISITRSPWLYPLYFFWPLLPILFFFESQMCPWLWISLLLQTWRRLLKIATVISFGFGWVSHETSWN